MVDYTCGNFPEHKVFEHVGHCYAPCPYDIDAPDLRTRHMLGLTMSGVLPTKIAHIGSDNRHYYMATSNTGDWGFTCTFSGCPFVVSTSKPYFYR